MNTPKEIKLKNALEAVPAGFVADARWLVSQGISRFLTRKYVESGGLERLERGVFRRPRPHPAPLGWSTCLLSLLHIMSYKIHARGITALCEQGYRHYLPLEAPAPVWLYDDDIPSWVPRLKPDAPLIARGRSLFTDPDLGPTENKSANARTTPCGRALLMSLPERALL
nr:AbiEi antitoxin N-terminal domain-containing protein [Xaviernesmea rhizosphaerae]